MEKSEIAILRVSLANPQRGTMLIQVPTEFNAHVGRGSLGLWVAGRVHRPYFPFRTNQSAVHNMVPVTRTEQHASPDLSRCLLLCITMRDSFSDFPQ
jgi:hypothetical protein